MPGFSAASRAMRATGSRSTPTRTDRVERRPGRIRSGAVFAMACLYAPRLVPGPTRGAPWSGALGRRAARHHLREIRHGEEAHDLLGLQLPRERLVIDLGHHLLELGHALRRDLARR